MKKICIVQNYPTPYRTLIYDELSKYYEVTVIYMQSMQSEGRIWTVDKKSEFKEKHLNYKKIKNFIINDGLNKHFSKKKYDLVIAIENLPNILSVLYICKLCKKNNTKFILWTGEFEWHHYLRSKLTAVVYEKLSNLYRKYLYKNSYSFLAYGQETKKFLVKRNVNPNKIFCGTQCIREVGVDKKILNNDIEVKFITIAYLRKDKGIDNLIRAFNDLYENNKNIKLTIIGEGEAKKYLEEISSEGVIFTGYLEGSEKSKKLRESDIFVFPTLKDSWGLVLNEAMEYCLPIISSDKAAGSFELVKDNGFIYEYNNTYELKKYMDYFINNKAKIVEMGDLSKQIIAKYSVEAIVKNITQCIES